MYPEAILIIQSMLHPNFMEDTLQVMRNEYQDTIIFCLNEIEKPDE